MNKHLLVLAHPNINESNINRFLLESNCDNQQVTVHDLYRLYPHFNINIENERQRIREAQHIIFQFPMYWYSCPALLKEWLDRVMVRGFAYAEGERVLAGKKLQIILTSAGGHRDYAHDGFHKCTYQELLKPFQTFANLCEMEFLPPLCIGDVYALTEEALTQAASDYKQTIAML